MSVKRYVVTTRKYGKTSQKRFWTKTAARRYWKKVTKQPLQSISIRKAVR